MEHEQIAEGSFIEPYQGMVNLRAKKWKAKFGSVQGRKEILSLKGETSADLRLLEQGDAFVCMLTQLHFFMIIVLFWLCIWTLLRSQWDVIS